MLNYLDIFSHRCRTTVSQETYPLYSKWRKASSLTNCFIPAGSRNPNISRFSRNFCGKANLRTCRMYIRRNLSKSARRKTLDGNIFIKRGYSVLGLFLMLRTQVDTPKSKCILWTNNLRSIASEVLAWNYFCPVLGLQVIISILAIFLHAYMGVTLPDGKVTLRLFLWVV